MNVFDTPSLHKTPLPFFALAGPDVIEDAQRPGQTLAFARELARISRKTGVPVAFKVSYDKANRTSLGGFRGPGLQAALPLFRELRAETGLPLLSDVHRFEEIEPAAEVLDILQIPAFLSRQTDFIQEVARTERIVNWKKGQFVAPHDVQYALEKIAATGNKRIVITERGYMFGYNNLVVDMRGIERMRDFGWPVVIDATHSVQRPSGAGGRSGGERRFVRTIARAAVAAGAEGVFLETHANPDEALCDGPNMIPLSEVEALLLQLRSLHALVQETKQE